MLVNEEIERSSVVANSLMNRERGCLGSNSYEKELGLNAPSFLESRLKTWGQARWLDLCCGRGKALIEAARRLSERRETAGLRIVGLDLVSAFDPVPREWGFLELLEASVSSWSPERRFDLITCVHGLHYVGDKLGLIRNAASWLKEDGVFLANLDPDNLKFAGGQNAGNTVIRDLRKFGFEYQPRKHLIGCSGRKDVAMRYRFLGADDTAGPNYTGQSAVNSHYERTDD